MQTEWVLKYNVLNLKGRSWTHYLWEQIISLINTWQLIDLYIRGLYNQGTTELLPVYMSL